MRAALKRQPSRCGIAKRPRARPRLQKTHSIANCRSRPVEQLLHRAVRGAERLFGVPRIHCPDRPIPEKLGRRADYLDSFHRRRVDGVRARPCHKRVGGKARAVLGNSPVVTRTVPLVRDPYIGRVGVDNTRAAGKCHTLPAEPGNDRDIGIIAGDVSSEPRDSCTIYERDSKREDPPRTGPMVHAGTTTWRAPSSCMQLLTRGHVPRHFLRPTNHDGVGRAGRHSGDRPRVRENQLLGSTISIGDAGCGRGSPWCASPREKNRNDAARLLIDHIEGRVSIATPAILKTQTHRARLLPVRPEKLNSNSKDSGNSAEKTPIRVAGESSLYRNGEVKLYLAQC